MMIKLDRRWIFLGMGLIVLIFLRLPLKVEYKPSQQTQGFFQTVESLQPGSIIFLAADYGPSSQAELLPMHEALVYHLLKRNIRIIAGTVSDASPPLVEKVFDKVRSQLSLEGQFKKYGIDYVNLGYKSGSDVAIAKIGTSIPETFPLDYHNTNVKDIPLLQGIINFSHITLLCSISSGSPGTRQWLQQVQSRYKVKMIAGVTAIMAPDLYSFFQSRQLNGFLGGLVGAAEYEYLLKRPGLGMSGMNVQSIAHVWILLLIALGNILYYFEKHRRSPNVP